MKSENWKSKREHLIERWQLATKTRERLQDELNNNFTELKVTELSRNVAKNAISAIRIPRRFFKESDSFHSSLVFLYEKLRVSGVKIGRLEIERKLLKLQFRNAQRIETRAKLAIKTFDKNVRF